MITVIDYGCGNLGSIRNMLKKISAEDVRFGTTIDDVERADRLILPGVGSYDVGMMHFRERGLETPLKKSVLEQGTPLLGICLGMQLLLEGSEEGKEPGLGLIRGMNRRFVLPEECRLKIPHMGWNTVTPVPGNRMFAGQPEEFGFYFVHSYHACCADESLVAGWTDHGIRFASAVEQNNIWGVQFHPEKSHRYGMQLLKNFVEFGKCSESE